MALYTNPTRFRWAALQLDRLIRKRLLLAPNIQEILRSLPETLSETYDIILREVDIGHRKLALTVLCWLSCAYRPLLTEELIEVCSISLERGGSLLDDFRLSFADILGLMPNLVTIEPHPPTESGLDIPRGVYHFALSHFSVNEYVFGEGMANDVARHFQVDTLLSHRYLASSCLAYLLLTNTREQRHDGFPLRSYAWELLAVAQCLSKSSRPKYGEKSLSAG